MIMYDIGGGGKKLPKNWQRYICTAPIIFFSLVFEVGTLFDPIYYKVKMFLLWNKNK